MTRIAIGSRGLVLVVLLSGLAANDARAAFLEQYEFQGQAGNETSVAPSFVASGLKGRSVTEGPGLTPSSGANSINASGFTNSSSTAYFSLGFDITAGYSATVNQIILTSRSSGTGPGLINVLASVDGGAFATVATITQTSTNFNDEFLSITPVTATSSLVFRFVAANQVSAAGGAVGSGGTFRIGDYNPANSPTPFTLGGTITPLAGSAVPEPSSLAMATIGLGALGLASRARRRAR